MQVHVVGDELDRDLARAGALQDSMAAKIRTNQALTGAEIAVDGGASSQGGAKTVSDALLTTYQPPEKH